MIDYRVIINEKYTYNSTPVSVAYIKGSSGYAAMYKFGGYDALEECIEGLDNTAGNGKAWKDCFIYRELNMIRNDRAYIRQ